MRNYTTQMDAARKGNRDTGDRGCCEERTYDVRGADEAGSRG